MRFNTLLALPLAGALALAACSPETESGAPAPDPAPASQPAASGEVPSPVGAILAKADALDGTEDQTVGRCANCALGMDGKAENALEYEGYTLHLCSPHCKDEFSKGTEAKVLALNVPAK